ncbi:hypothetical protein DTO271G3_6601 [Paecilomyces variotii]|nr:hypothetical protein DTO271G3_6601 [Paecilomyces variotii]
MATTAIPQFLLPRGISPLTLRYFIIRRTTKTTTTKHSSSAFSTIASRRSSATDEGKARVLAQPDKFRPPSHPSRRVLQTRNGKLTAPPVYQYGPSLTEKEKEEMAKKKYPNMFPPEGTVMHKFLTSRWIHVWIAMSVLTTLATFTFTTNFKATSPFAHLLPPWSGLLTHPIDTISQAISVYKMHVQHNSMLTREKRHRRIEDAEKRRQYRIAHGLEEPEDAGSRPDGSSGVEDDASPIAGSAKEQDNTYVDFEGKRRPVKKWLGIW